MQYIPQALKIFALTFYTQYLHQDTKHRLPFPKHYQILPNTKYSCLDISVYVQFCYQGHFRILTVF